MAAFCAKRRMGLSTSLIKLLLGLFNLIFCVRPLRTREPLSNRLCAPAMASRS